MKNRGRLLTLLAGLFCAQCAPDSCSMSGTNGTMKSNPDQNHGKTDVSCFTFPNATIFIEISFRDLDLGKEVGPIGDLCPATGAQTDINHIAITNGEDELFYCGGLHLVKLDSFKRAITSSENTVLVKMTWSIDQPTPGSYKFDYKLIYCPDIEGGIITRRERKDGQSFFDVQCQEGWTGSEGPFICKEDGSWSTKPHPPSCQAIIASSSSTTTAITIESTAKEETTTATVETSSKHSCSMSGTNGTMKSNPDQNHGKTDVSCFTFPNATIFIEISFRDLDLGKKVGPIGDPCPATGAQTDINHIAITNGEDELFYCGGLHLVKLDNFKRAIMSSENTVLVKMTWSIDQPTPGSYKFDYKLIYCPDIEGGIITRRERKDGQSFFDVQCQEGWTGSEGPFICKEDGSWSTEPHPPSCQAIIASSSSTTTATTIESTAKEETTTATVETSSKQTSIWSDPKFWYGVLFGGVLVRLVKPGVVTLILCTRRMMKRVKLNNQNNGDDHEAAYSSDTLDSSSDGLLGEQIPAAYPKVHGTRRNSDEEARPEMPLLVTRLFSRLRNYFG